MYSALKGIEVTAVASVLKLYFRELSSPLFPCEKYYDFTSKDIIPHPLLFFIPLLLLILL